MKRFVSVYLRRLFSLLFVILCSTANAGEWQPLCIEGSSCEFPYKFSYVRVSNPVPIVDRHASGPLITSDGILLNHSPPQLSQYKRHVFQLSDTGLEDFGEKLGLVSNTNAIQVPGGRTFSFGLGYASAWYSPGSEIEAIDWGNQAFFWLSYYALIGPPIFVNGVLYIGAAGGGGSGIYSSTDEGMSWTRNILDVRLHGDRFNLLANPEETALWAIESIFQGSKVGLWESDDRGATWAQVDDGSFPFNTVRVVHDPDKSLVSYALTSHGLFVSVDRGVSWQGTTMTEPIHGMVFVERMFGLPRVLIVGTDTGVWVSVDEATSWISMSRGLPETAYTVTYAHGQLLATSDLGYFTCNAIDCAGLATHINPEIAEIDTLSFQEGIRVSWESALGATVYRVFRCLNEKVESCGYPITFSRGTYFYDQYAKPGIIYHYRVRACVRNNCGSFSGPVTGFIRLAIPKDIVASDGAFDDHVRVRWGPVDGATIYRVFRCLNPHFSSCGLPISYPRETFFSDTNAVSSTVYHYRVRACTTDTCGHFSMADTGYTN